LTNNFIYEIIITIIFVFYAVCLFRNFYLGINVSSEVDHKEIDEVSKTHNSKINMTETEELNYDIEICKKCDKFRYKRDHHCSICNHCIDKLDHHCFLLNNCIGRKNYNYFLSYLFLVNCLSILILSMCTLDITFFYIDAQKVKGTALFNLIFQFPLRASIVWFLTCISTICVGLFFLYHLKLVLYEKTSLENKYNIIVDKQKEKEIRKLKFAQKLRLTYKNLMSIVKGENIFDLFWPD